jgi:hypothetical protein
VSIAVICDKCDERIEPDQNRVTLIATRYTHIDDGRQADPQMTAATTPVPGAADPSAPPGAVLAAPGTTITVPGSSRPFTAAPAFDGDLTMHEECWDNWISRSKGFEQLASDEEGKSDKK